jgi:hypothetical protein
VASILLVLVALVAAAAIAGRIDQSPPVRTTTKPAQSFLKSRVEPPRARGPDRELVADLGKQYCIGGSMCPDYCEQAGPGCETQAVYSLKLDRPASISRVEFHAQDEVVLKRQAALVVKLDGRPLGTFSARASETISIPVMRPGRHITIESRDPHGSRRAGEEAVISEVHVFGREPR